MSSGSWVERRPWKCAKRRPALSASSRKTTSPGCVSPAGVGAGAPPTGGAEVGRDGSGLSRASERVISPLVSASRPGTYASGRGRRR